MTRQIICILLLIVLTSCDRQKPDSATVPPKVDTVKNSFTFELSKTLSVIKEQNLGEGSTDAFDTRFFFFQPLFRGPYEFYKINYSDRTLLFKQFTETGPDGGGNDSVYLTKTIKLTPQDINKINSLQDKSMFWNLKTVIDLDRYPFDSDTYIYESIRVEENKRDNHKHHHLVYSYAPTNKDFINFGQYLRLLAGQKNTYKD